MKKDKSTFNLNMCYRKKVSTHKYIINEGVDYYDDDTKKKSF